MCTIFDPALQVLDTLSRLARHSNRDRLETMS